MATRFAGRNASEGEFSAEHFRCVSAHADVAHCVALACGAYKDLALAMNFPALFDERLLVGLRHAMTHHPCSRAPGCRTCGRIFPILKKAARVQAGFGILGLAR